MFGKENANILNTYDRPLNDEEQRILNDYNRSFIEELNSRDIVAELNLQRAKVDGYICPICDSGSGSNGTGVKITKKHDRVTCFAGGCFGQRGEDVVGALMKIRKCSMNAILREEFGGRYNPGQALYDARQKGLGGLKPAHQSAKVYDWDDEIGGEEPPAAPVPAFEAEVEGGNPLHVGNETAEDKSKASQAAYYNSLPKASEMPIAMQYLARRGLTKSALDDFGILYDAKKCRVILPSSEYYYSARAIDDNAKPKYLNGEGTSPELWNAAALTENAIVYVAEGVIDAMSIEQAGGHAVSIISASNTDLLLNALKMPIEEKPLILIALDNDKTGNERAADLEKGLESLGYRYTRSAICGNYKDPNARLIADSAGLEKAIAAETRQYTRPNNTADYVRNNFVNDIIAFKKQGIRKTGYANYDKIYGGLYAGLYTIGAISSLGKTTFCHQLAEQLAESGNHVIFFSLEQSRLELVTKSISRAMAKEDMRTAVSNITIRTAEVIPENFETLLEEYADNVGERLSIIEAGVGGCTPTMIRKYVEKYIKANKVRPVVMIDYLQVLKPDDEKLYFDRKKAVDDCVIKFKNLSKDFMIPVILISSLNRSNYVAPVDFEAFKESGEIEYTSDVVLGLQLECMNNPMFSSQANVIAKRDYVKDEKARNPRRIELVTLKDRYKGLQGSCYFDYYAKYDYFAVGYRHQEYYGESGTGGQEDFSEYNDGISYSILETVSNRKTPPPKKRRT